MTERTFVTVTALCFTESASMDLDALSDAVMDCLLDLGAPDPAVSADLNNGQMEIELTAELVDGATVVQVFSDGREFILDAFAKVGVEVVEGIEPEWRLTPSRSSDLISA